jgi:transposase
MFLWIKMRAYSQDLRDRVISHYNRGQYQIKDLAKMFDMTRQTIGSWIKRYKKTGNYSSRQHLSKG